MIKIPGGGYFGAQKYVQRRKNIMNLFVTYKKPIKKAENKGVTTR